MSDKLVIPEDLLEMRFRAYTMHNDEGNCITLAESEWRRILARAEARVAELEAALAAMTEDRNAWRDEHNGDCPNEERVAELEAALGRMRAPVSDEEMEKHALHHMKLGTLNQINDMPVLTRTQVQALIAARAAAPERSKDGQ